VADLLTACSSGKQHGAASNIRSKDGSMGVRLHRHQHGSDTHTFRDGLHRINQQVPEFCLIDVHMSAGRGSAQLLAGQLMTCACHDAASAATDKPNPPSGSCIIERMYC
jgi:hypothetical protein